MLILYSLKIMECHLVAQKRAKYISEHLVDRVMITVKEARLTGAVLLPTERVTLFFILCMDRLVIFCTSACLKLKCKHKAYLDYKQALCFLVSPRLKSSHFLKFVAKIARNVCLGHFHFLRSC